jgi:lycopene cyclase CruA
VTERAAIFDELQGRYPRTVAAFSSMPHGEQALHAVRDLERQWIERNGGIGQADPFVYHDSQADLPSVKRTNRFDVVIAGGGLGLVVGAALARRGLRVLVFDRDRVGSAHREWNISQRELAALEKWGIFSHGEIASTIATHYDLGVISFDAEQTGVPACPLRLNGVLDVALDAQAVLDLARSRFTGSGGVILEHRAFKRLHLAEHGAVASVFEVEGPDGPEFYRARLAIDTMGSVSPIAMGLNGGLPFDGVCPTAGTVVGGLEHDSRTGDVLVSVAPVQDGRQLIWEGFPGHDGETTVYLFYYDRTGPERAKEQSLLDLFERYFELLPTYRSMPNGAQHLKPVFGYIPARHGRTGRTAARGLLCLGDSAAGQSPLTFCGFGSFVRHIGLVSALADHALRYDLLEEKHLAAISPHQANLRVAWVFSRFMQPWAANDPAGVNRLMNVFCRALAEVGPEATVRFLQDRYTFREYLRIMLTTARHYPQVFALTARVLGPPGLVAWAGDIASFATDDALRAVYARSSKRRWRTAERWLARRWPGLGLRLMAARSAWQAIRGTD